MKTNFYSNCLIEAVKMKILYRNKVKVIVLPKTDRKGWPHFMWYDTRDGYVYDFYTHDTLKSILDVLLYKGFIKRHSLKYFNIRIGVQRGLKFDEKQLKLIHFTEDLAR